MDFSTIRNKLNRYEYDTIDEILSDIRLIFANCATYNLPTSIVALAGQQLQQFFERRVKQLKLNAKRSVTSTVCSPSADTPQEDASRKRRKRTL